MLGLCDLTGVPCSWPRPTTTQPSEHPPRTEAAPGALETRLVRLETNHPIATQDSGEPREGSGQTGVGAREDVPPWLCSTTTEVLASRRRPTILVYKDGRGSRTNMKECACRLRGGSNGWGTASSTYDAMAYSQSASQASTWFFGKYMLPPVNVSNLFKHS